MPEPITLAAAAVALLAPYLVKTGEAFASKAGEALAEKAAALYQTIKSRFTEDTYANETLLRLQEAPDSKARQTGLENVLAEKIEEDPAFGEIVRHLIQQAKAADTQNVISYGERSVAIGGDVTNASINTGDVNSRNS